MSKLKEFVRMLVEEELGEEPLDYPEVEEFFDSCSESTINDLRSLTDGLESNYLIDAASNGDEKAMTVVDDSIQLIRECIQ